MRMGGSVLLYLQRLMPLLQKLMFVSVFDYTKVDVF